VAQAAAWAECTKSREQLAFQGRPDSVGTPFFVELFAALALRVSGGRGRRDRGPGRGRRDRGIGRGPCPLLDPNGDRAQNGHDPHPNTLQKTVHRHDEVQPSERPDTEAESSNPRAIYNVFPQDTNSLRSTRNPRPGSVEEREPREEAEAARY
jgi:hypothetical protein